MAAQLARYTVLDRPGDLDFDLVEGDQRELLFLRRQPGGASDAFLVISKIGSPLSNVEDKSLGPIGLPSSADLTRLTICQDVPDCDIADAQWLPGEDLAFVYTSIEGPNASRLRLYAVRGGAVVQETLSEVTDGTLGALAVSADGQRIVVERLRSRSSVIELWMLNRGGNSFTQFLAEGARPAWR